MTGLVESCIAVAITLALFRFHESDPNSQAVVLHLLATFTQVLVAWLCLRDYVLGVIRALLAFF